MIPYPLETKCTRGLVWHPYTVEFKSPDGTYSCHIYAISEEHAQWQLAALKETGVVVGRPLEITKE